MRFLVFGAGAIGTYVGGSLAFAGNEVVFLERPGAASALAERGLSLEIAGQTRIIQNPTILESPDQAFQKHEYDAAILAVKSYDTQPLLEMLSLYANGLPPILCLQNGVENEARIANLVGTERVISGTVTSAIGRQDLGSIRLEKLRGIGIAQSHLLSSSLVEAFSAAGLNARLFPDAFSMKWSKMLTNLLANASSAILGMTAPEVFADPQLYSLEMRQLREALLVMDALKLRVVDLPRTPTSWLARAVRYLPNTVSQPILKRIAGEGRGGKMPSFYLDLRSGSGKSEVDYLNGAVVRFGENTGVATPVNRLLNETLLALTRGQLPIDEFDHQPSKLISRLNQAR